MNLELDDYYVIRILIKYWTKANIEKFDIYIKDAYQNTNIGKLFR